MAILIEPPANWDNLQGKPAILSDNQIEQTEILNFGIGVLGDGYGNYNFCAKAPPVPNTKTGYSFYPTFTNYPWDTSPRRAADIWSGFDFVWGTEYLAFGVGECGDSSDQATERMRLDAGGLKLLSGTFKVNLPVSTSELSIGSFYRDSNGFVKIVI